MNKILYFIILLALGILYEKYKDHYESIEQSDKKYIIDNYIFKNKNSYENKPFLWIHNSHNINSRKWLDFGSRNSHNINRPYIKICLAKIINMYSNYFNVVIIDDTSFNELIPNYNKNINQLPDPIKTHERIVALTELIYIYGGIICPNSFFPLNNNLITCYEKSDFFTFETLQGYKTDDVMMPTVNFIGCKKLNPNVKHFIDYLKKLNVHDYTNNQDFLKSANRMLNSMSKENKLHIYNGKMIGSKYHDSTIVTVDDLTKPKYKSLDKTTIGLYIPKNKIEQMTHYNWITYLNENELYNSNTFIGEILHN
jgi:hypothetical protein